jgi:hypothetical protein
MQVGHLHTSLSQRKAYVVLYGGTMLSYRAAGEPGWSVKCCDEGESWLYLPVGLDFRCSQGIGSPSQGRITKCRELLGTGAGRAHCAKSLSQRRYACKRSRDFLQLACSCLYLWVSESAGSRGVLFSTCLASCLFLSTSLFLLKFLRFSLSIYPTLQATRSPLLSSSCMSRKLYTARGMITNNVSNSSAKRRVPHPISTPYSSTVFATIF